MKAGSEKVGVRPPPVPPHLQRMTESTDTPWYRLGYALEAARSRPTQTRLRALGERLSAFRDGDKHAPPSRRRPEGTGRPAKAEEPKDGAELFDQLIFGGAAALAVRLLRLWPAHSKPGWGRVSRAALAGAGATLLREMTAPLLRGRFELPEAREGLGGRLVSGAARGALYGGLIEPRLPGPPLLRGLAYGAAEYAVAPYGGLSGILASAAPWAKIPGLKAIVGEADPGEDSLIEHVVFGIALALMSGADIDLGPLLDDLADDEVFEFED